MASTAARGALADRPDADKVAADAAADFCARYGAGGGAPIVVLLAALDEAESVASVVAGVPAEIGGLRTECLVIDDGSSDGTGEVAARAGAMVCRLAVNLGQGRALRAGYRLAATRGARVIATMDADGQFDPEELPRLVEPVLAGRADFVNGSRRLGRSETTDSVRRAGVVAFGALVSILTGARITDPANGFRAFTPEVVSTVALNQVQYQTAELLIGALAAGFTVVEVPVTVLARDSGLSKKGSNLRYGYRFARAVIGTWWSVRKGRRDPARPHR